MIILNLKKVLPFFITVIVFVCALSVNSIFKPDTVLKVNKNENINSNYSTSDYIPLNTEEMRGVWITYMELSMENEQDKSEVSFKNKFEDIAKNCVGLGFNTLIVQVHPFGDAIYNSSIFPWSHILTGTQGKDPGYDALEIICVICEKYGLKIHAWINPYRITLNDTPANLSDENPYKKDTSIGIKTESGIILDPSNEKAQQLICEGVKEIVTNYPIDGIQFDDYFYPTDISDKDQDEYVKYVNSTNKKNCMDIEDWRKSNINILICNVYRTIHNINNNILFGISPQGNLNNNDDLYADVKSWCSCKGFVDYICPQIYFSLENPTLSFEDCLNSWKSLEYDESVELYIGLAGYKACTDNDENTWQNSDNILSKEYNMINSIDSIDGFMLYSYSSLIDNNKISEIQNLRNSLL